MSRKAYAIDTSVLLENPKAIEILRNGVENDIYIPNQVILELDGLKKNPRLNHIVKEVTDELLKHKDHITILGCNTTKKGDDQIIAEIRDANIEDNLPFIFVTNDKLLSFRVNAFGITTQDFKDSHPYESESQAYTGIIDRDKGDSYIPNCFYWNEGKLVYNDNGKEKSIGYENDLWDLKPRTPYQNAAMELLLDPKLDLISIQSAAGFGKSMLSLAAALYWVLEKKRFKKILIFKHNIDVGEERLGFLPGNVDEKIAPYFKPMYDLLLDLHHLRPANKIFADPKAPILEINTKYIEFLPINFIRGMNISNAFVIVDECQNFSRQEMKVILSRMGENVKCACIGDVEQIDSPYLNQSNNGLNWIVRAFMGQSNYGHIVLRGKHSRGPIADMVRNSIL